MNKCIYQADVSPCNSVNAQFPLDENTDDSWMPVHPQGISRPLMFHVIPSSNYLLPYLLLTPAWHLLLHVYAMTQLNLYSLSPEWHLSQSVWSSVVSAQCSGACIILSVSTLYPKGVWKHESLLEVKSQLVILWFL